MPPSTQQSSRSYLLPGILAIILAFPFTFFIFIMAVFSSDSGTPTAILIANSLQYFALATVPIAIISAILAHRKHSVRWALVPYLYMGVPFIAFFILYAYALLTAAH